MSNKTIAQRKNELAIRIARGQSVIAQSKKRQEIHQQDIARCEWLIEMARRPQLQPQRVSDKAARLDARVA